MARIELRLAFKHGASDGDETVADASKGARVRYAPDSPPRSGEPGAYAERKSSGDGTRTGSMVLGQFPVSAGFHSTELLHMAA